MYELTSDFVVLKLQWHLNCCTVEGRGSRLVMLFVELAGRSSRCRRNYSTVAAERNHRSWGTDCRVTITSRLLVIVVNVASLNNTSPASNLEKQIICIAFCWTSFIEVKYLTQ